MSKTLEVAILILVHVACFTSIYGEKHKHKKHEKRSADYPPFNDLLDSGAESLSIQNTDCVLTKSVDDCETTYSKSSGLCPFKQVLLQLFPAVSLSTVTKGFLPEEKFLVDDFKIVKCNNDRHETVLFDVVATESLEVAPRHLTLAAASELNVYWGYKEEVTLEKISVNLNGHTSVGSNTAVPIKFRKKPDREDYVITMEMASLNVNNFLDKFGIEASAMISDEMQLERNMLGLASLHIQNPEIKGIFSAGDGFELTATGTISAPELPSDATKFYVIVQDFKKSVTEEGQAEPEGFKKPIGGIFALYKQDEADVTDAVMSLTGLSAPQLNVFRRVRELAITVATDDIYFINYPKLHDLSSKFVPSKGLNFIDKGLNIMHFTSNSNGDIKNEEGQTKEKILFRGEVTTKAISWKTPEVVETTMQQVGSMAFPEKSLSTVAIDASTKVRFESIDLVRESSNINVKFNLSDVVPVLRNNLVSLLNATIILTSARGSNGDYDDWTLNGGGREVILDELVDITIEQTSARTYVSADANIFSMQVLRNRTKASYFEEDYAEKFPYALDFPLEEMRYEASFERNEILRLKGKTATEMKADIEILYFLEESGPQLKVALLFKNEYLHKVVNTFYGEQKMRSDWMKFEKIGILFRHKKGDKEFDRSFFQDLEYFDGPMGQGGGVGLLAQNFILSECPEEANMCKFLRMHNDINPIYRLKYYGRLALNQVRMEGRMFPTIWLSENFCFGGPITFKLRVNDKGDRNVLVSTVYFSTSREYYPAKIYNDASDRLIFDIGDADSRSSELLKVDFALMDPLQSKYAIPSSQQINHIEFKSRLHLGTVTGSLIAFSGATSRQNTYLNEDKIQFVGEKTKLSIQKIEQAFGLSASPERIRDAEFKGQVIVAYNSVDEVWNVPDYDVEVEKGLHFYGKLLLNAEEEYEALVTLTESRQLEAELELPPLRYGRTLTGSEGKKNFQTVNLFLFKDNERQETGPTLYVKSEGQELKGYCKTIGIQGEFSSTYARKPENKREYRIELNGKMFNEVNDANVIVTTDGEGKPESFSFKYQVDITAQAKENLKQEFRNSLSKIQQDVTKGKEAANSVQGDVEEQYNTHVRRKTEYDTEIRRVEGEILQSNQNVDQQVLDISTNCIDKCKTVSMPGIEWKDDCISQPGESKRTLRCMTWNEDKEKVINVICLLKCEATKYSASGSGFSELHNIRLLLNRYREVTIMSQNQERMIAVLEEAKTVSADTRQLIEDSTNFDAEITQLLAKPQTADMVTVTKVTVEQDIEEPYPPCLPFHLMFAINAPGQVAHDGTYDVCFNGEFYQNLGVRMLRVGYSQIDAMYKALEEAELRYVHLKGIDKSLQRVMDDIKKNENTPTENADRRSETGEVLLSPAERRLIKIAKRKLPKFTSMNDKTQMGFVHYSPWAVSKRSNPFNGINTANVRGAYNMSALQGHSACHKVKKVVQQYKDVANGLRTVTEHYQKGKLFYGNKKDSLKRELDDSYAFIVAKMNKTSLSPLDQESMLYWYKYTQAGLRDYFDTFERQLSEHNKRGLEYWRSDISTFFDKGRLFNELHEVGRKAYSRSNIPKKNSHVRSFNTVGETIRKILTEPGVTLEEANMMVNNVDTHLNRLHKSTFTCK